MKNIPKFASGYMAQGAGVGGVEERAAQAAHDVASAYLMHRKQWDELGESGKQLWRDVVAAVKPILLASTTEGKDAKTAEADSELKDAIARRLSEIENQVIRAASVAQQPCTGPMRINCCPC